MNKGKVLAIDYGTRRVGIATGDLELKMAFPRTIIENKGDLFHDILDFVNELDVKLIVIGLPLNMEEGHKENPIMKDVVKLVEKLGKEGLQVETVDERLSSFEAEGLTKSPKKGYNRRLDAHAAQIILQRYFDNLS
jgi:putative Holliday junction resolvase